MYHVGDFPKRRCAVALSDYGGFFRGAVFAGAASGRRGRSGVAQRPTYVVAVVETDERTQDAQVESLRTRERPTTVIAHSAVSAEGIVLPS